MLRRSCGGLGLVVGLVLLPVLLAQGDHLRPRNGVVNMPRICSSIPKSPEPLISAQNTRSKNLS